MLVALRVLENVARPVVENVESYGARKQWDQCILLKLVVKNSDRTLALRPDALTLLRVLDCNIKCSLLSAKSHTCNTEPSRKEPLCHFEEPLWNELNIGVEVTRLINIGILVHHVLTWNAHLFEL